jgi:hypothetical protein
MSFLDYRMLRRLPKYFAFPAISVICAPNLPNAQRSWQK